MQGLDRYVCTQIVVRKVIGFYMRSEDVGLSYSSVTGSNSAAASQLQLLNRRSANLGKENDLKLYFSFDHVKSWNRIFLQLHLILTYS